MTMPIGDAVKYLRAMRNDLLPLAVKLEETTQGAVSGLQGVDAIDSVLAAVEALSGPGDVAYVPITNAMLHLLGSDWSVPVRARLVRRNGDATVQLAFKEERSSYAGPSVSATKAGLVMFWRDNGAELRAVRKELYDALDALIRSDERAQIHALAAAMHKPLPAPMMGDEVKS